MPTKRAQAEALQTANWALIGRIHEHGQQVAVEQLRGQVAIHVLAALFAEGGFDGWEVEQRMQAAQHDLLQSAYQRICTVATANL